jgi:hypothetical protein
VQGVMCERCEGTAGIAGRQRHDANTGCPPPRSTEQNVMHQYYHMQRKPGHAMDGWTTIWTWVRVQLLAAKMQGLHGLSTHTELSMASGLPYGYRMAHLIGAPDS